MITKTERPAAGDVSERYAHPDEVLHDLSLSNAQKIKALKDWEQDLRQLMVASDENMPGTATGQPAESLKLVREALGTLSAAADTEKGSPSKSG